MRERIARGLRRVVALVDRALDRARQHRTADSDSCHNETGQEQVFYNNHRTRTQRSPLGTHVFSDTTSHVSLQSSQASPRIQHTLTRVQVNQHQSSHSQQPPQRKRTPAPLPPGQTTAPATLGMQSSVRQKTASTSRAVVSRPPSPRMHPPHPHSVPQFPSPASSLHSSPLRTQTVRAIIHNQPRSVIATRPPVQQGPVPSTYHMPTPRPSDTRNSPPAPTRTLLPSFLHSASQDGHPQHTLSQNNGRLLQPGRLSYSLDTLSALARIHTSTPNTDDTEPASGAFASLSSLTNVTSCSQDS